MKLTLKKLRAVIREAVNDSGPSGYSAAMKVATVYVGEAGRVVEVDGVRHNVHQEAEATDPNLDFDRDEEGYDAAVKRHEESLLRSSGVTHIVDYESFGNEEPHPLDQYLSQ